MVFITNRVLATALVFALSCSSCLAAPYDSDDKSYDCLKDSDCKYGNVTSNSRFQTRNNSLSYCCRNGDAIEIFYKKSGFSFHSSYFGDSNEDNSESVLDSSSQDIDTTSQGDSSKDKASEKSKRSHTTDEVKCTCRPVDREKIKSRIREYIAETSRRLNGFWSRPWW